MPTPPTTRELSYAPKLRWFQRARFLRLRALFIFGVLAAGAWEFRDTLKSRASRIMMMRQCLTYSPPTDQIVYLRAAADPVFTLVSSGPAYRVSDGIAELPVSAWTEITAAPPVAPLASSGGGALFGPAGGAAAVLSPEKSNRVLNTLRGPAGAVVAFLHKRRSPAGHERLVCVSLSRETASQTVQRPDDVLNISARQENGPFLNFSADACSYSVWGAVTRLRTSQLGMFDSYPSAKGRWVSLGRLCIFAGRADASDESRFTIEYEMEGKLGTIDGQLRDDDSITLSVRNGPATRPTMLFTPALQPDKSYLLPESRVNVPR